MGHNTVRGNSFLRFALAGIICFAATYLSEITLGAVATFPFILVLPAVAFMIYGNVLHITGLCALSAFIYKCVFSAEIHVILLFALFCAVLSFISVGTFRIVTDRIKKRNIKRKVLRLFPVFFVVSLAVYILVYGTVFGNLSSKSVNREYLEKTYPQESFNIGSTYFSVSDMRYVTEFSFTAKERYMAKVSADKDGNAVIDGYRDLCRHELLSDGMELMRTCLTGHAYEGTDFVIRYSGIDTDDIITSKDAAADYYDKMCYEIALYYQFRSREEFEAMCLEYIGHIDSFENLVYKNIRFYGFDDKGGKDFAYTLDHDRKNGENIVSDFNDGEYARYFSEKDTHKYWELMG